MGSSGDYSGSAGDSGYGGGAPKYVPSQEALEREFSLSVRNLMVSNLKINGSSNTMNAYNACDTSIKFIYVLYTTELNPDAKTVLQVDEYAVNEGLSTEGYMKLIGRQEPASDRYAKTVRTKIDGVDGKSIRYCIVSCQAEVHNVVAPVTIECIHRCMR